eukprot:m.206425 g.206425  ORF g.206425 m.206425 type:complete len:1211 (+) comp32953_c0_seq2:153-3785(+)
MYIKQVTIQGFKSYKNETVCEPFSPRHNVVVGRNGSGKSNFFFAIRFVLSDMYTSLSNQERSKLLHGEGVGMSVMSAFVEMVFDNSDNRIPIDKEEVTLRRSIGLKKDEYFLDSKHVSKQEVMNLLESSGFSRSNPYYIVQQGKIMQLATMKDGERLHLLKEVAGTKVYDDRRAQSMQILEDTSTKKERIEEVLKYIEERLAELEDEKDELKEYQELDRSKRAIEYTIYDKELRSARDALEKLDAERQAEAVRREKSYVSVDEETKVTRELAEELGKLETEIQRFKRDLRNIEADRSEQIKEHAKLELDVQEELSGVSNEKQTANKIKSELFRIRSEIKAKQEELKELKPKLKQAVKTQETVQAELDHTKLRQDELLGRETRTSQFNSADERDAWIADEIKSHTNALRQKKKMMKQSEDEVAKHNRDIENAKEELIERENQIEERKQRIESINTEFRDCKHRRDELTNQRNSLWSEDAKLDTQMSELKLALGKSERALYATTSKVKAQGVAAVRVLMEQNKIKGIHGPLVDLITCPPDYRVPVEVTAMDSMFNIVVDSDEVASQIIDHINRQKIEARITCLPLNRLKKQAPPLPKGKDFIPMVKKIECADIYRPAVNHVFGKTLICRDLEVAAHYSREESIDAVTLDGDKVSRKGAMTGGFVDERSSKLELSAKLREYKSEYTQAEDMSKKIKLQLTDVGQKVSQELSTYQKLESEKSRLRQNLEHLKADLIQMKETQDKAEELVVTEARMLQQHTAESTQAQERIEALKAEKGTELDSGLDSESRAELQKLTDKVTQLTPVIMETSKERATLEQRQGSIERQLKFNLEKQEKKLLQAEEDFELDDRQHSLENKQDELTLAKNAVEEANSRYAELEEIVQTKTKEAAEITSSLDDAKAEERKRMSSGADSDKRLEKIMNKRAMHLQKQEEHVKMIRDLGALPKDFERYHGMELKKLYKLLSNVNKKLKDPKYRQVNKKALDQYVSFSEQRDVLVGRKDDQDSADHSIEDLITVLDGQKDEAIERTFKQVSMYFSQVFAELVPSGRGALIMQKRADGDVAADDSEDAADSADKNGKKKQQTGRIEQYVGVAVKVSFTGKSDETHLLQQLSGGQRTIVALALIFAIQRCDPAPFYLFDEIDAALDAAHRTSVAEMIHRLCDQAQFIVTTFRPEMLQKADKFYGVKFHNKVSRIDCVTKDQAMQFIDDEAAGK